MTNKSFGLKIILILLSCLSLLKAQEKEDSLLLYRQGKFQEAIINTQNEIKHKTNNLDARVILIWSLIAIGEYKRAELESIKGLEINKNDSRIIQALGEAYFFQGQYKNALKHFQKYISLDSNGARIAKVYILTADSFYKLERYNEADFAYENALRFLPNNQNLLLKLAKARLNAKNKILAKETLTKLLTLNPNHLEAKNLLKKTEKNNHTP
ncbi:Tetratricopeptide repeat family protein [Borrelia nietonii YOR]|uniref:Tetratricopeptide repeat family protein n=1 Tax=Borrelia nietonii YOR TaxID=1293576 RepID=A0ABN4C3P3_9SPIR|nr:MULTISPECIES: tetratricopeptide repeat protein [Borrelia]AHH03529.1 Tetratricopeptide repeat family protein [Borrelia nietonii YOR]AHH14036.1 Tetratricopeptide repeat family protein [Borrelia hermsii MTW]UPA09236.1 tetratricopeptide repeat protein [Borrelia nietonii YOR]